MRFFNLLMSKNLIELCFEFSYEINLLFIYKGSEMHEGEQRL